MNDGFETKCTMTGCGQRVTQRVTLSLPYDVAGPDGAINKAALADAARFAACDDHAEHIVKVFYGAAYALSGTVTASNADA